MASRPAFSQSLLTPKVRAVIDSDGVWLHTPKDDDFIEALKGWFKWHDRHWEPSETAWRVDGRDNIESAIGLFKTFFPEGVIDGQS